MAENNQSPSLTLNAEQLADMAISALEDVKGQNIQRLDVTTLCDFTDIMLLCSGTSNRHTKSLADNVVHAIKKQGVQPLSIEGKDEGEWVLVDLGDVVVHVMQQQIRDLYQLEQLWSMKPARERKKELEPEQMQTSEQKQPHNPDETH